MEKCASSKSTAAIPPPRKSSMLITRAKQYPRKAVMDTPPPAKSSIQNASSSLNKETMEGLTCKQAEGRRSFPTSKQITRRQAVSPVTPTRAPRYSPFEKSVKTPRSPHISTVPSAFATPFTASARTPRTPPATQKQVINETEIIREEINESQAYTEDEEETPRAAFHSLQSATICTDTEQNTPTLNIGGLDTSVMDTTTYCHDMPKTEMKEVEAAEVNSIRETMNDLHGRLNAMEQRLKGQEKVQEEQGKALTSLANNQDMICKRIDIISQGQGRLTENQERLGKGQERLTENQEKLAESQAEGFEKLASLIANLQTTMQTQNNSQLSQRNEQQERTIGSEEAEIKQHQITEGEQTTITQERLQHHDEEESRETPMALSLSSSTRESSVSGTSVLEKEEAKVMHCPIENRIPGTATFPAQYKADKPEKFTGKIANNALEKWIHAIENYAKATRLSEEDTKYFAISSLKDQAADWWLATTINLKEKGEEIKDFEEMKIMMRRHFADHATRAQAISSLRTLQEKKSVVGYTQEFLKLRLQCPELPEKVAKDYFVEGLQQDIRPHVALAKPETVDEAVEAAVLAATAVRAKSIGQQTDQKRTPWKERINENSGPRYDKNKFNNNRRPFNKGGNKIICNFCKKPGHKEADCRKKAANNDKKKTEDEKKKKPIRKNNVEIDEDSQTYSNTSDSDMECDVIKVNCVAYGVGKMRKKVPIRSARNKNEPNELITVLAHINGRKARILIDSGAGGNFISEEFAKIFKIRKSKMEKPIKIQYADKRQVQCIHEIRKAKVTIGKYEKLLPLIVAPLAYDAILGKPWLTMENPDIDWQANRVWVTKENTRIALPQNTQNAPNNIIFPISMMQMKKIAQQEGTRLFAISIHEAEEKKIDPTATSEEPAMARRIMEDFPNVFQEEHPGGLPQQKQVTHKIELVDESNPPCKQMHLMCQTELIELRKQLDAYLEKGWIRPSDSPFGAPVLFAMKKDGSKRLCIDYRALNRITKKSKYPLPRFEELQSMIGQANWFSKIDLANGYHQVPMAPEDCLKTAFRTRFGQFEWTVMPFGLTNAPATFQRLINNVLRPLQNKSAAGILDDILIFTKGTKHQHDLDIREVVKLLAENKLYAKPKKCSFFQREVEYWGHVITRKGWTTEKNKIQAIKNWPSPLPNVHAVRSFMGMCTYYRRYVKDFAKIALPLHELIRKEGEFQWNKQCDEAMQTLKDKLTTAPVLKVADCSKPFIVTTDASNYAIGAVLQQYDEEGELRPIAFDSRKLQVNRTSNKKDMGEVRYPTHEKEMLAIIHAAKIWRHLLLGNKVTFLTDHMPLKHLQTQNQLSDRQLRWMQFLQQYEFEIKYKPGCENIVADALSRRCDLAGIIGMQATDEFLNDIKEEYLKDKETEEIMKLCKEKQQVFKQGHKVFLKDDTLCVNKNGRILTWIPKTAVQRLLEIIHEEQGHPGKAKLSELIHRNYWWPKMTKDINECVRNCIKCQETKAPNSKQQGLLQPLPVAKGPWQRIAMDLITDLPLTNRGNDAILTITDTFTKYIHILPTKKTATSRDLAEVLFEQVIRIHGVPAVILSDRDPRFLSEIWRHIWTKLGTRLAMSTAFHPQTDGQSERTNRSVIQAIKTRVSRHQDDWDLNLPIIQLTLNNLTNETTGFSPFFANFNFNPRLPPCIGTNSNQENLGTFLNQRMDTTKTIKENITRSQQRQKAEADKHRKPCDIKKGDQVLLSTKHLRFRGPSKKLAPRYIGPFRVEKVLNGVTAELKLPEKIKIFNKFHVSLLKHFQGTLPTKVHVHPGFLSTAPIEEHEVEQILQQRTDMVEEKPVKFYLVKWKNADLTHATWEPEAHLANARAMLRQFMKTQETTTTKNDKKGLKRG